MNTKTKMAAAFAALTLGCMAGAQAIQVQVDGQYVNFVGTQPQYVNGRVLVPLRGVFQQMGASVNWDPASRTVSAMRNGSDVELRIGDHIAMVNGATMNLDVPAMIIGGSTMVPIRFVSEALGAQVGWMEAAHLVTIDSMTGVIGSPVYNQRVNGSQTIYTPARPLRRVIVRQDEVIPVTLDHSLSTTDNAKGDMFTATVQNGYFDSSDIPDGTKVEGHIAAIRPKRGSDPAILDLAFDRLVFPNGRTVRIDGTLTSLDDRYVTRDSNGTLVSRNPSGTDQRLVYAGYGAGGGLLLGVLTNKPVEGALLGGVLGYLIGQVQHDQRNKVTDVTLNPGTQMGVHISRDVMTSW